WNTGTVTSARIQFQLFTFGIQLCLQ
ncbi:unnamed protein product, partial [Allacma fusca]